MGENIFPLRLNLLVYHTYRLLPPFFCILFLNLSKCEMNAAAREAHGKFYFFIFPLYSIFIFFSFNFFSFPFLLLLFLQFYSCAKSQPQNRWELKSFFLLSILLFFCCLSVSLSLAHFIYFTELRWGYCAVRRE